MAHDSVQDQIKTLTNLIQKYFKTGLLNNVIFVLLCKVEKAIEKHKKKMCGQIWEFTP